MAAGQGQRQGGGGGNGLVDAARRPSDGGHDQGLRAHSHGQGAAHRARIPGGHAVERHQPNTDEHRRHIQEERQYSARRNVHHAGRRSPGDRVRGRVVRGEQGQPQVLPDDHVRADRAGADHHRLVFPREQVGQGIQHRSVARVQPVVARGRLLVRSRHGAVHHLRGDTAGQRAQRVHVVAHVLEQRARLRRDQSVPENGGNAAHIRLLLAVWSRVPGHRAVHVLLRAGN